MRIGLSQEVAAALVRLGGEATAREIADSISASVADVSLVLRDRERFSGPWLRGRAPRARKVYRTASGRQAPRDGKQGRSTQGGRLLDLLADGRWHSTAEILRVVPCIVHSRVAEINKRGQHRIEHQGKGGGAESHQYRLVTLEEAEATPIVSVSSSGTGSPPTACDQTAAPSLGDPWPAPLDFEQLTLGVAA